MDLQQRPGPERLLAAALIEVPRNDPLRFVYLKQKQNLQPKTNGSDLYVEFIPKSFPR